VRRFFLKEARPIDTSGSGTYSRPAYGTAVETVKAVSHIVPSGQTQWYPPVLIGARTIEAHLFSQNYVERGIELMRRLTPDDYTAFLIQFFSDGLSRFGRNWRYADIVTVLSCLADLLAPKRYLEIGVRRGRSVAAVVSANPILTKALTSLPSTVITPQRELFKIFATSCRDSKSGERSFLMMFVIPYIPNSERYGTTS
jgi:hypothetical protein